MSYRDRSDQYSTPAEDDPSASAPRRVTRPGASPTRPIHPRRAAPERAPVDWDEDPAEVDRYLDERARTAPVPPRRAATPRSSAQAPARGGSHGGARGTAPLPIRSRSIQRSPQPGLGDPTDPSQWDDDTTGPWIDPSFDPPVEESTTPPPGSPPARRAAASASPATRARGSGARPSPPPLPNFRNLRVPAFISGSELARDPAALWLLGVAFFGLGVMAALLSSQLGGLDPGVSIHVDAAGRTDRWGDPGGLWRLPLLATMLTLMNATAAWFLIRSDRFAARFLLAAAVVVQIVTWVAVVDFL